MSAPDVLLEQYWKDIRGSEPLSRAREAALAEKIQAGDLAARNELVEANLWFVVSIAKQHQNRGLSLSDLISAGNLGLMEAANRFNGALGNKFISYAVWWIRQAILMAIAMDVRTIRNPMNIVQLLSKISKSAQRLREAGVPNPGIRDIADDLGVLEDEVASVISFNRPIISLDDPWDEDGDSLLDRLPDESGEPPDAELDRETLREEVQSQLNGLPHREAEVLRLYYGLGGKESLTLEDIAARFDLTRERIRQLKERALQMLRRSPSQERLKKAWS